MLPFPVSTFSYYLCVAKQNLKPTSFCKKLAEVIVILNRASSIDKHAEKAILLACPLCSIEISRDIQCICYSTGRSDIRDIFHEL